MEDLHIKHRSVLRHHYTRTSNVLLFGYRGLSDSAKITYQVVDSFDWAAPGGVRKGFAHPSLMRLAAIRGTSARTVRRHLHELEVVGLLSRKERPGNTSLIIIEDPSAAEAERYLRRFAPDPDDEEPTGPDAGDDDYSETPDTVVRGGRTKLSGPSIQENQTEKRQINVVERLEDQRGARGRDASHIGSVLAARKVDVRARRTGASESRSEVLAGELCEALGDPGSRAYYRRLARTLPTHVLFETLGAVREAARDGRIRRSRGAYFVSLIERRGSRKSARPRGQP